MNPATLMLPSGLYSVSFLAMSASSAVVLGGSVYAVLLNRSVL